MGVGWKVGIQKRGREKTRGWERSFGGRGRLFIAVGMGGARQAGPRVEGRRGRSGRREHVGASPSAESNGPSLEDKFMRLRSKFFGAFYRQFFMPVELDWIMKPRSSTAVATGTLHCAFCSRKP